MLLVPIGQEDDQVRVIPWVTIGIIAICIIVHLLNFSDINHYDSQLNDVGNEIYEYYKTRPYLELDPEIEELFIIPVEEENNNQDAVELVGEQEHLDELVEEFNDIKKDHPFQKWGLIPKKRTFITLFTHMFWHGGWLHLLFNLLYLYVMGPFIEDTWGKIAYSLFYMVTGVLTGLTFALQHSNSALPMIGASGAISAVMGGFLIRHWHARIKFFYWIWFGFDLRFGTFSAPAWFMIPLGIAIEYANAIIMEDVALGSGGVAHWAHVWGYVFGIGGAFLIQFLKIEKKYVIPKLKAKTTYVNESVLVYDEAMKELNVGNKEAAYHMLMDLAKEQPYKRKIMDTLWQTAVGLSQTAQVAPLMTRLIEREVQQDQLEAALFHYQDLCANVPGVRFSTQTKIKIFQQATSAKDAKEAKRLLEKLLKEINLASPPGLVMDLYTAVLKYDLNFDQSMLGKVMEIALAHPEIPADKKESFKQHSYALPGQNPDVPDSADSHRDYDFSLPGDRGDITSAGSSGAPPSAPPAQPPPIPQEKEILPGITEASTMDLLPPEPLTEEIIPPPPAVPKRLQVTKAVPLGVYGGKMAFNLEGIGERLFALEKTKVIAVVKISPPGERPFFLIDLLLDHPGAPPDPSVSEMVIRTFRLLSMNFDPRKFVPRARGPMEAFKIFTGGLLKLTQARPFPDQESVLLEKAAAYRSLKEYENSFLKSWDS